MIISKPFHAWHQNLVRNAVTASPTTLPDATAEGSKTEITSNPTISPYTTALNGVNVPLDNLNQTILWWSIGGLALVILVIRGLELGKAHIRHLSAMSSSKSQQKYWAMNHSEWWPNLKKHLIYAPLLRKRHNREIRLSSAVNIGTLPSRLHFVLLSLYLSSNIAYCVMLDYSLENKYELLASLRGRSGVLAVANMIPLVILAGRNNPLIPLLKISFDTYNLLHRWMGRMVVIESIVHTLAWLFTELANSGWPGVKAKLDTDRFIQWGMVGTVAMIVILFATPSAIRHAFYETFLNLHILMASAAIAGIWIHCDLAHLSQFIYVKVILGIWIGDRLARMLRIVLCNYSRRGMTNTTVECLPGEACRVTIHLPRHLDVHPGTHAYLRFAGVNFWESHPFSIAWYDHQPIESGIPLDKLEKGQEAEGGLHPPAKTTTDISFIIQAQTGMTRKLYNKAMSCSPRPLIMRAAFEGPYAGHHSLSSYGHCVLFAGASGITHQVLYLRHLLHGYHAGTVATRRIVLIWIVRDLEHLEWVRPWMDTILQLPGRRDLLNIKLFITRPKNAREIASPSATVQMYPGRPNVELLLRNEVQSQVGAMCVTVCGPGGLADSVRGAVRGVQGFGAVDFVEEAFTW